MRHGLLHHSGRLHDLRQEHSPRAEEVTDLVHPVHQRSFDDLHGMGGSEASLFDVGLDVLADSVAERMGEAGGDRKSAPFGCRRLRLANCGVPERDRLLEETFGGVGSAGEDDVLAELSEMGVKVVVEGELARVDDREAHPGADRVNEEHRVHGLADDVVALKGERQVRDSSRDVRFGGELEDLRGGLDEVEPVTIVFGDPGRDREDVRVEDDVLLIEPDLLGEEAMGAATDLHASLNRVGLAVLVEGHDDHRGAVISADPRLLQELLLAGFQRDRVDHRFALQAGESCLDYLEAR